MAIMLILRIYISITCLYNIVGSIPQRGNHPWSIILCKFRGNDYEPKTAQWFQSWLFNETLDGSVAYYFKTVSNSIYTINGSNVHGWYPLPYSKADVELLAKRDKVLVKRHKDKELQLFHKTKEMCILYALHSGALLHDNIITVINDENTAVYCKDNGVLLTPKYLLSSALTHEMTHSLNIGHSYSDKSVRIFPHSALGEYDDKYDLMSTANAYMYPSKFGLAGPGLIGPHLDYLGWLPSNRTYVFGTYGEKDRIVNLSSLSVPYTRTDQLLLLFIPYDKNDTQNFYTVELRTPNLNDKGINKGAVVLHKVQNKNGYYFSALKTKDGYELSEGSSWFEYIDGDQFVRVRVISIDTAGGTAIIRITSTFAPEDCASDEVPRLTQPNDPVCVVGWERNRVKRSNKLQGERRLSNGVCLPGFVKREALVNDNVCVSPNERYAVEEQNRLWLHRSQFYAHSSYGMNMCKSGYVWRLVDVFDYVCVKPRRVQVARQQDKNQKYRQKKDGSGCTSNFVPRNAFQGDTACVTKREREEVLYDSMNQKKSLRYYGFFNGVDNV